MLFQSAIAEMPAYALSNLASLVQLYVRPVFADALFLAYLMRRQIVQVPLVSIDVNALTGLGSLQQL